MVEYKHIIFVADRAHTNGQALKVRVYFIRLLSNLFNLLAPEFEIYILAHPVCKMQLVQEPIKVAL
jgi:hypothetical protein